MKIDKIITESVIDSSVLDIPQNLYFHYFLAIGQPRSEIEAIRNSIFLFDTISLHLRAQIIDPRPLGRFFQFDIDESSNSVAKQAIRSWGFIAISENISSYYNFQIALSNLIEFVEINHLKQVKIEQLKSALTLLKKFFPKIKQIRNASTHRAEILYKFDEGAITGKRQIGPIETGPQSKGNMSNVLVERTVYFTRKGELLQHDISWESFRRVYAVYLKAITSFPLHTDSWDFPRELLLSFIT